MKCLLNGLVLPIILGAAIASARVARADDPFLGALSKIATREIRKQLRDKPFHFAQGPLEGRVRAVEPDTLLAAEVKGFNLANDLLTSTVTASGRFELDGKVDRDADVSGVFDVKLAIVAEVRFIEESGKFFIEPKIKDMQATLAILQLSPANLSGGKQLLSNIALAAFNKNKDRIIAEANKRLGKRPF
jgi:hypothetical protein